MSSQISVYAIPVERLTRAAGSCDSKFFDGLVERHEDFLNSIDEIDEAGEFTCADAIWAIIENEVSDDIPGYLYGYALQALCMHLGKELPGIDAITGATEWMESVDEFLKRHRVPVTLTSLVYGGSPMALPEPDDYPFIGQWPANMLADAREALEAIDTSALDDELRDLIVQMRGWITTALKIPGASIIAFLT